MSIGKKIKNNIRHLQQDSKEIGKCKGNEVD